MCAVHCAEGIYSEEDSTPRRLHYTGAFVITARDALSVLLGALIASTVHFHGIVRLVARPELGPGELNAVLFASFTALLAVVRLVDWAQTRRISRRTLPMVLLATSAALVIGLVMARVGFPVRHVEQAKGIRDLAALALVFLAGSLVRDWLPRERLNMRAFAATLLIGGGVVGPIVGALTMPLSKEGRLAGFPLTPTMLAISSLLILLVAYGAGLSRRWLLSYSVLSAIIIFATGTRVALVLLLGFLVLYLGLGFRKSTRAVQVGGVLGVVVLLAIVVGLWNAGVMAELGESRVLSSADAEGGSIASRTYWILLLSQDLMSGGVLGGFGAGAAEARIGLLPHFDVLRFWYDYSGLFVVLFTLLLAGIAVGDSRLRAIPSDTWLYLGYLAGTVVLLTTHNVFQDVASVLLIVLVLATASSGAPRSRIEDSVTA